MKENGQHDLILKHLKLLYARGENNGWIAAYKLRGYMTPDGRIGDAVDVRLRELRKKGKVESRREGKYEEYRIAPAPGQLFPTRPKDEKKPDALRAFMEA